MLEFIRNFLFQKKIKRTLRKHPGRKDPVNPGKEIGILCTIDKADNIQAVVRYREKLVEKGKKVKILAFSNTKEELLHIPFPYFNRKDITWFDSVKGDNLLDFTKSNYDLLINLDLDNNKPIHFIAKVASARLKVATFLAEEDFYQIMINLDKEKANISDLIGQISQTLNTLSSAK